MSSPLQRRKKSVDLAAPAVRVSRIRRDPPPPVKEVSVADLKEREARGVVIGIIVFALALFVVLLAFSNWAGWSPSQYTIVVRQGN